MKTEREAVAAVAAVAKVSASIGLFKRFVEALDTFLKCHDLGSAEISFDDLPNLCSRGYDFAIFHLYTVDGSHRPEWAYLNLYTNGTATGEIFLDSCQRETEAWAYGVTWEDAITDIFRIVGMLNHQSGLSKKKIEEILQMLDPEQV